MAFLKVVNDNSTKGQDDGQDNESETYYTDYQWQKNIEAYNLRITTGTTNEMVYARSDIFQENNTRENHSLYTKLDKKMGRVNLSFGARYEVVKGLSLDATWTYNARLFAQINVKDCNMKMNYDYYLNLL